MAAVVKMDFFPSSVIAQSFKKNIFAILARSNKKNSWKYREKVTLVTVVLQLLLIFINPVR
jgi:hypothetical protein